MNDILHQLQLEIIIADQRDLILIESDRALAALEIIASTDLLRRLIHSICRFLQIRAAYHVE